MTLPVPFYSADGVTIYNADCRPILATLDPARVLVIADPPYGIGVETDSAPRNKKSTKWTGRTFAAIAGDSEPFDPAHLLRFRCVVWGANNFAEKMPSTSSWIVWDKRDGDRHNNSSDFEMAWTNLDSVARIWSHLWMGLHRESENGERTLHPTQKPVALAKWIISRYGRPGDTIVEPYMGAGFATVAAKELGYPAIGCELVEDYCKVVVRRVSQRVLDFGAKNAIDSAL